MKAKIKAAAWKWLKYLGYTFGGSFVIAVIFLRYAIH